MVQLDSFRTEVRTWLEANCPKEVCDPETREPAMEAGKRFKYQTQAQNQWVERMASKGWTVPEWPKEYGGAGLSKPEIKVLKEEIKRIGAGPTIGSVFGRVMMGNAVLKYGSEELKKEHLPKVCRGEIAWCQGYSEPNAGSDLASLATKAEDMGDHYLVNGSKIWTTYADKADWIFCLVRTGPTEPKHDGISFLLIDMDDPGVTVRPITLINGGKEFCETFFDNVKVPKTNVVGQVNKGWDVAKYLLTFEREMISNEESSSKKRRSLSDLAKDEIGVDENAKLRNSTMRRDLARLHTRKAAMKATMERITAEAKAGQSMGAISSVTKLFGTEVAQQELELQMDIQGPSASAWGEWEELGDSFQLASNWLYSRAYTIYGGTSEVQLNIIAKRVLGLPQG